MIAAVLAAALLLLFASPSLHSYGVYDIRRGLALGLFSFTILLFSLQRGSTASLQRLFRQDLASLLLLALPFGLITALSLDLAELRFRVLGLSSAYNYILAIVFYGVVTVEVSRNPYKFLGPYQLTALIVSAAALAQYLGPLLAAAIYEGLPVRGTNLFIYFEHPRFFSQIVSPIFLLVACGASLKGAPTRRVVGWSTTACLFLVSGLAAQGAGPTYALIGSSVLLFAVLVVLRRYKTVLRLGLPFATMIGAVLIHFLLTNWVYGGDVGAVSTSDAGRFELWRKTLEALRHSPVVGYGPGSFPLVVEHSTTAHTHNALLQFWFEGGLLAALALAAFTTVLYGRLFRLVARTPDGSEQLWMLVTVIWVVTAMLIHAMVSGIALMPMSQFMLVCMLGIANGIFLGEDPRWRAQLTVSNNLERVSHSQALFVGCLWLIVIGGLAVTTRAYMDGRYCPYVQQSRELGPALWGHHSCPIQTHSGAEG